MANLSVDIPILIYSFDEQHLRVTVFGILCIRSIPSHIVKCRMYGSFPGGKNSIRNFFGENDGLVTCLHEKLY